MSDDRQTLIEAQRDLDARRAERKAAKEAEHVDGKQQLWERIVAIAAVASSRVREDSDPDDAARASTRQRSVVAEMDGLPYIDGLDDNAIVEELARRCWSESHGAGCPQEYVPTPFDLAWWLPNCPQEARDECAALLPRLFNGRYCWWEPDPGRVGLSVAAYIWEPNYFVLCPTPLNPAGKGYFAPLEEVHAAWLNLPEDRRPQHPLAPLWAAWQQHVEEESRRRRLGDEYVTATAIVGLVRRPRPFSACLHTPWERVAVDAATVDGQPLAAAIPGYPRRRALYEAGQSVFHFPRSAAPPSHLFLEAIGESVTGVGRKLSLPGDMLLIAAIAYSADRRLEIPDSAGAALLARTREGGFRSPKQSDLKRWHTATLLLHSLIWRDLATGKWFELVAVVSHVTYTAIGRPEWANGNHLHRHGGWTLTSEGSAVARARIVANADSSPAGRILTAIEFFLASQWDGRPGIAPFLRPADGRAGPGTTAILTWRYLMQASGFTWDQHDRRADRNMYATYRRAVCRMVDAGYRVSNAGRGEARAGDTLEIVDIVRASRHRKAGLVVRASQRFVAAAKQSAKPKGKGFRSIPLTEWLGGTPCTW